MKTVNCFVVAVAAMLISAPVQAGEYSVKLGAFMSASPDYEGSDDMQFGGLPFLSLSWESDPVVPKGGTGLQLGMHDVMLDLPGSIDMGIAKLYRPEGVYRANIAAAYNGGRDQDDNDALNGMGNIDGHAVATIGLNFEAKDSGWQYGVSYSRDLNDETEGTTIDGQLGYGFPLSKTLILSNTGNITWADENHMQSYFGVSSAQASASSNAQFTADSGIKSVGIEIKLNWMISKNWMTSGGISYTRLMNDAADSPLVKKQGSANQFAASLALIYAF
jgi:outer membrane protein